jgi:hypothetical protein
VRSFHTTQMNREGLRDADNVELPKPAAKVEEESRE